MKSKLIVIWLLLGASIAQANARVYDCHPAKATVALSQVILTVYDANNISVSAEKQGRFTKQVNLIRTAQYTLGDAFEARGVYVTIYGDLNILDRDKGRLYYLDTEVYDDFICLKRR